MKNIVTVSVLVCFNILLLVGVLLITTPSFSHLMTDGIGDEEVYEMIESLVADTPHARLAFESMPETGMTVMTIIADSPKFLRNMIEKGTMDYFPMLDGDVTVTIEYVSETTTAVMTIIQSEQS